MLSRLKNHLNTFTSSEIEEKSTTTYTTGEDVVLSCVFDFTKGGTGPTTVKWSDLNDLTENDEYTVDLGEDCKSIDQYVFELLVLIFTH